jgi:HEAT repeat protein
MNLTSRRSAWFFFFSVMGALVSGAASLAADELPANDPVEALAAVLRAPTGSTPAELDARRKGIAKYAERLQGPGLLRNALMLDAWRGEDDENRAIAEIDRHARGDLLRRFERSLRMGMRSGDPATQLATVAMIGEVGKTMRWASPDTDFGRTLATELVEVLKNSKDAQLREAAARVLGKIYVDPKLAVPVLDRLLKSRVVSDRRGALAGLGKMARNALELTPSRASDMTGFKVKPGNAAAGAALVPPAASKGLADEDAEVRRLSAEAIREAARVLSGLIPEPRQRDVRLGEPANDGGFTPAEAKPLALALKEQAPNLGRRLDDADLGALLAANEALEAIADARLRSRILRASEKSSKEKPIDELLAEGLRSALPGLAKELSHKEVRVRLAALYVLETLETEAAPVAASVVLALTDPNSVVRWGAVRTLGGAAPLEAGKAVPGLAGAIDDRSGDVRGSALHALARYGPAAKAAVPALTRALAAPDAETQVLSAQALGAIGPEAGPAVPALTKTLAAPETEARAASAQALGKIGPAALSATAALQKALSDPDSGVREAATDALLLVQPPPRS